MFFLKATEAPPLTLIGQHIYFCDVLPDRGLVDAGVVHDCHLAVQDDRPLLGAAVSERDGQLGISSHLRALPVHGHFYRDVLCCGSRIGQGLGAVATRRFHSNAFRLCAWECPGVNPKSNEVRTRQVNTTFYCVHFCWNIPSGCL